MAWLPRLRVYRHNLDDYFFNERMRGEVAHRVMEHLRVTDDDSIDAHRAVRLACEDFPELGALPEGERQTLDSDLHAMALWALGEDRLRSWLAHGVREPEFMDDKGQFKRLDLLYADEETVIV